VIGETIGTKTLTRGRTKQPMPPTMSKPYAKEVAPERAWDQVYAAVTSKISTRTAVFTTEP
jgi:hypothetical protein